MNIPKVQNDAQNNSNEKLLAIFAVAFAVLAWIVLLPTFYVANLWLLPLHEITAWAQHQVKIFESFGLQLDVWEFRRYASLWSSLAPCVSLVSSTISVLVGFRAYRTLRTRNETPRSRKLLVAALALGILGMLATGSVFGVSLIYLVLYWLMHGL